MEGEDGNIYYKQLVAGPTDNEVKFVEAWSSMRTLYKHLLLSPTVARVFGPDSELRALGTNVTVTPNFKVSPPGAATYITSQRPALKISFL